MIRFISLILPLAVFLIAGPIWLSYQKRGLDTWFPAQLMALAGLIISIVVLQNGVLGDVAGAMNFVVLSAGPFLALVVAWIILPGKPRD